MVRALDPNNNVLTTFVQSAQKATPGQAKEVNDSQDGRVRDSITS